LFIIDSFPLKSAIHYLLSLRQQSTSIQVPQQSKTNPLTSTSTNENDTDNSELFQFICQHFDDEGLTHFFAQLQKNDLKQQYRKAKESYQTLSTSITIYTKRNNDSKCSTQQQQQRPSIPSVYDHQDSDCQQNHY
jgi:hypothetical protein